MGDTRLISSKGFSDVSECWSNSNHGIDAHVSFVGESMPSSLSGDQSRGILVQEVGRVNPIVISATSLLTLMTQISRCQQPPYIDRLHHQVVIEVRKFTDNLASLNFSAQIIDYSAYCLCAAIDESVLSTSWGTQSLWVQKSLLSMSRSETLGGERFYIIAEALAQDPRKNIEVLELIYILLSLGFEGRYFGRQVVIRDEIRNRLFEILRKNKGKREKVLSPIGKDSQPIKYKNKCRHALRRLFVSALSGFSVVLLTYNIMAYRQSFHTINALSQVGRVSPVTSYSQLIDRSLFPDRYHR